MTRIPPRQEDHTQRRVGSTPAPAGAGAVHPEGERFPGHSPSEIKSWLLQQATESGFQLAGIAPATACETEAAYRDWLAAGHHAEMSYLARDPDRRVDPRRVWSEAGSLLVVGINYHTGEPDPKLWDDPLHGKIARYAAGDDYHEVISARLRELLLAAQQEFGPELHGKWYVDTGPLLERDLAARAGLGWFGKNTCLLHRRQGSYFFLGALLLNLELPPDVPTTAHCGSCSRCLEACPTGAFVGPYVLDARRCISYLTIELRGPIPRELRPLVGNWIFGCDICQEVCPWNRKSALSLEPAFEPRAGLSAPELIPLLGLSREEFSNRFRGSPIKRARWGGFLRNVCVALGNSRDPRAGEALIAALQHPEPLVRGHAAWALGRIPYERSRQALDDARSNETDPWVWEELELASGATPSGPDAG